MPVDSQHLDELTDQKNLLRAWRWLRSNPDACYKSYCRDLYSAYAVAEEALIKDLRDRLRRGIYNPSHACKLYLPKPSGVLRPYSILCVDDQIVYQAAVNLVAERLFPKVRLRYNQEVFGHLYAGKTSTWFYRKWSDGYRAFNNAARKAFSEGFRVAASFDLTACYDSIDHGVLSHFLAGIGLDKPFAQMITRWLSVWTATDRRIYHNHGIPQGPLSSGLLSEVVLQYFDSNRGLDSRIRYLRYVDDIRLFAEKETDLRRMLVRLDLLSKDIGLFPQSSKIDIHTVKDIEKELKTVSRPTETSVRRRQADPRRIYQRLVELSKNYKVDDPTRFKYVLAHARPSYCLAERLFRLHEEYPEFYTNFARYLSRYKKIPYKPSVRLVRLIQRQTPYPAISAAFLNAMVGRLHPDAARQADGSIKSAWRPNSMQPEFAVAAGTWLLTRRKLTFKQAKYACTKTKCWWARARLVMVVDGEWYGDPSYENLLNAAICDDSSEVAMAAAYMLVASDLGVTAKAKDLNPTAAKVLKASGMIKRARGWCGVSTALDRMIGPCSQVPWKKFFGSDYGRAERQVTLCRALAGTNITAWVNAMDVFDDWLLIALYRFDPGLGKYNPGGVGSVMGSKKLTKKYPAVQALVYGIHQRRYESFLSHAKIRSTGKATGAVKYPFLGRGKRLLRNAVNELARTMK